MRFKLDENMPEDLVDDVAAAGHDAATCGQEGIGGTGDPAILAHAHAEGRALATFDLDFSNIRTYPPENYSGIVVFRMRSQDLISCRRAFKKLLEQVPETDLPGNLILVEETRIRIRRPTTNGDV